MLTIVLVVFYVFPILYLVNFIFGLISVPSLLTTYQNWIFGVIGFIMFISGWKLYNSNKPSAPTSSV